jgi:hypothetical protein
MKYYGYMKKTLIIIIGLIIVFTLFACISDDNGYDDCDDYCECEDCVVVIPPGAPIYEHLFMGGNYNRPGLFDRDGNAHQMPTAITPSGQTLNVEHYGARPNDPTFDNHLAFRNAIRDAGFGDTVIIPAGRFYFRNFQTVGPYLTHISLTGGIIFSGAGEDQTFLVSNFTENQNRMNTTSTIVISEADVIVRDITFTAVGEQLPDQWGSGIGWQIFEGPRYQISVQAIGAGNTIARNILISNVTAERFIRKGVRITQAREVTVEYSTFQNALSVGPGGSGYGISIQGMLSGGMRFDLTGQPRDTLHNVVRESRFLGPYLRHGVLMQYYAHNNYITHNYFRDILLNGVDFHGQKEYSNEVSHNRIYNNRQGSGISVGNSGATHRDSGRNNYIHNNVIDGSVRGMEIIFGSPNAVVRDNVFKNLTRPNSQGIFLRYAPGAYILDNTFYNITSADWGFGINLRFFFDNRMPEVGVTDDLTIKGNTFTGVTRAIFFEVVGTNLRMENNSFTDIGEFEFADNSAEFIRPEVTDHMNRPENVFTQIVATDSNFVRSGDPDVVQGQENMQLKTSPRDWHLNRVVFMRFDLTARPAEFERVYLSFTARVGTTYVGQFPTLNFHASTTFTDWTRDTITWNNARLFDRANNLAIVHYDPLIDTVHRSIYDFTFPVSSNDWITFYIDITDFVVNTIAGYDVFTIFLTEENLDDIYMEVYAHTRINRPNQAAQDQALRLLFTN